MIYFHIFKKEKNRDVFIASSFYYHGCTIMLNCCFFYNGTNWIVKIMLPCCICSRENIMCRQLTSE